MQANPVIVKELRGRMRGWRAAVVLSLYLIVLSGVTMLFYMFTRTTAQFSSGAQSAQIGKGIFGALVVFQTIMVSLLTPGFTAGAITSEREQKTYDLLMTTLLPPRSVVFGKLGSALAYVALLIIAIAPLESLAFMFGGVSPEEIILSQVVMLGAAILFASIGIFWSSILRSSVASNVLTYGTILFLLLGIPLLYTIIVTTMTIPSSLGGTPITQQASFIYISGIVLSSNPLIAMGLSDAFLLNGDPLFVYTTTKLLNGHALLVVSPWLIFCLEALIISAFLVVIAIRMVRPIKYRVAMPPPAATYAGDASPPEESGSLVHELAEYEQGAGVPTSAGTQPGDNREVTSLPLPPPPPPPSS